MQLKYIEAPITEYLHRKAALARIPLSGTFEVTPVCNMNCKMCYVRMSKEEQEGIRPLHSAEEWLELGKIAKEKGMLYLLLTGGEPFSHPQFREIVEGLHKLGLLISINSNGTLITEETVAWLKKVPPTRINITLYGASDETYRRLCGNPKGFTQVTKAIRLLKEARIPIKINCSVTPYNCDDLEEIFAFGEREELIVQATSYMFPPLRRDASMIGKNERFTAEEAAEWAAKIELLSQGRERFLARSKEQNLTAMSGDLEEDCFDTEDSSNTPSDLGGDLDSGESAEQGDGIRCRAGKCSFWVTWDGRVLPCGMLPGADSANVFSVGFDQAWDLVKAEADAIRLPVKCKSCKDAEHCKACAAVFLTETGNYSTIPTYRCQMARRYPSAVQILAEKLEQNV